MNLKKKNYLLKKLLKWANKKCKNFNIYNVVFFQQKKKKKQNKKNGYIIILQLCDKANVTLMLHSFRQKNRVTALLLLLMMIM